jgi:alpha-tubulin suppressor-like RCC1 family protein
VYDVVVSNVLGAVVSAAATLEVRQIIPTVSAWPSASAIYRGEPLSKSILSGGSASVAGSFAFLSPTDTPPVGTASHAVRFTPEDTTHYLAADGMVAVVVVSALEIEEVPEPVEASAGTSFTLDASATGAEPRHFQWYRNGEPISGATNATLAFSDATLADTGLYQVLVTNALSLRLSAPTRVAVDSPKLIGWGGNDDGQLGDGSTDDRTAPVFIAPDAVTAVAGAAHSLFVTADGSLRTMGANASGQLGDGTTAPRSTPVAVLGGTNVVAVAAGAAHSLFVAEDGILRAMGANAGGQLGDGTTTPRSTPVAVPGGTNVVAVAAGAAHSLFVTADGALWAMGDNASGQLGDGTTTPRSTPVAVLGGSNVVAVAAGAAHSLFLTSNGAIWAMGGNDQGQLGDGSTTPRPTPVCIAQGIRSFAAGGTHSLLLDADGTLRATGANADGQLGDGTATPRPAPVTVVGGTNVAAFAAGAAHSLLLDFDGTLLATGANDQGQLGDGSTTPRLTPEPAEPVLIAGLASGPAASHVLAIGALVYDFVYVPLGDGTVVITGYVGEGGDIAIPEQLNGMAVAAIADEAFLGASGLVSVHIPATVTNIGASAFAYCPLLMTFTVDSANSAYQSLDGVLFSLDGTVLAQYPVGRGGVYTLPEGVATIAAGAFAGADGLTSVIVPTSTTAIGDGAFASCANLATVYFRGDAPTTGEDVFGKVLGIVYYPPTASGWGATFGGLDAFAWNAAVEAGAGFGMQGGVFGFNVVGSSGMVVIVEAADDLTSPAWTPVSTQTLSNGSAPFEDPGSVDKPSRFYRLRMP